MYKYILYKLWNTTGTCTYMYIVCVIVFVCFQRQTILKDAHATCTCTCTTRSCFPRRLRSSIIPFYCSRCVLTNSLKQSPLVLYTTSFWGPLKTNDQRPRTYMYMYMYCSLCYTCQSLVSLHPYTILATYTTEKKIKRTFWYHDLYWTLSLKEVPGLCQTHCFLNINDLSEVQNYAYMSSNSWTWECPHTKDGADHVPLIFVSSVIKTELKVIATCWAYKSRKFTFTFRAEY